MPGRFRAPLVGPCNKVAAQVLARSLDLDLLRVDLAGVVNKYVGETEKKLRQVFDACEDSGALLFFDEADALFGNRTQVKDAHDRFANRSTTCCSASSGSTAWPSSPPIAARISTPPSSAAFGS